MTRMHRGFPTDCNDYLEIPVALLLDDRLSAEAKAVMMLMLQASKHGLPFAGENGSVAEVTGDFSGSGEIVPVPCKFLETDAPLAEITGVLLDAYNEHMGGPAAKVRALFGTSGA